MMCVYGRIISVGIVLDEIKIGFLFLLPQISVSSQQRPSSSSLNLLATILPLCSFVDRCATASATLLRVVVKPLWLRIRGLSDLNKGRRPLPSISLSYHFACLLAAVLPLVLRCRGLPWNRHDCAFVGWATSARVVVVLSQSRYRWPLVVSRCHSGRLFCSVVYLLHLFSLWLDSIF